MIIAVCICNKCYLEEIKSISYRYCENKKIEVFVECFLNGDELINSPKRYNMVFIDCAFSADKWISVAERIRCADNLCSIIFLNRVASFSGEAFKSRPNGYVLYPIRESALQKVLDEYFVKKALRHPLLIKSWRDTVHVNAEEIIYLEADNKHSRVYLEDEVINYNQTMSSLYMDLPKYMFLKISRWNIVNAVFVEKFNNCEVTLKNGEKLFIGRSYLKEFKQNYNDFVKMNAPDDFNVIKLIRYG